MRPALNPRHWPLLVGLTALRALTRLPLRWQLALGRRLGRLAGCLARRRRRIAATNIGLCFPQLDAAARQRLVDAQFEALGMGVLETATAWWASDAQLAECCDVQGWQHLDAARATGRGILLLTGHFTTLELGARFLVRRQQFHAMYRRHRNPLYEQVMHRLREQHSGLPPLARGDLRGVLRALRAGRAVWYAPDQHVGRSKQTVDVPFFGVPARTITATSRLARAGNALVVPYFPQRLANGRYRLTILPPLQDFPSTDETADTARINALIESAVRQVPEQYLWVHRRFRSKSMKI